MSTFSSWQSLQGLNDRVEVEPNRPRWDPHYQSRTAKFHVGLFRFGSNSTVRSIQFLSALGSDKER